MKIKINDNADINTKEYWLDLLRNNNVIFYGIGNTFSVKLQQLQSIGITPSFLAESGTARAGQKLFGHTILSLKDIVSSYSQHYIYITSSLYYKEIKEYLINNSIDEDHICPLILDGCFDWGTVEGSYDQYILDNSEKYEQLSEILEDKLSLCVLQNRINFFFDRKREHILKTISPNMYFDEELVRINQDGVYLDVGAYDGDTIHSFYEFTHGKYGEIIAFEPEPKNIKKLEEVQKMYHDVTIVPSGCGKEAGVITFSASNSDLNAVIAGDLGGSTTYELPVVSIDEIVQGKKVEMIKMDIEGSEMSALEGAISCIKENKPILAISVYHRPEDIYAIPFWIKQIRPDYKIYLRHYTQGISETVCIAL